MKRFFTIFITLFALGFSACVQNEGGNRPGPELLKIMNESKKQCASKGLEAGTPEYSTCYEESLAAGKEKVFGAGGYSEPPLSQADRFCNSIGFHKDHADLPSCKLTYLTNVQNQLNYERQQQRQMWLDFNRAMQSLKPQQPRYLGNQNSFGCIVSMNGRQISCR